MWSAPLELTGQDEFGIYWGVPIRPDAERLGFIVHKGDEKDSGPDMFLDLTQGTEAWVISGDLLVYTEQPDPSARPAGDLNKRRAHWVTRNTIAYPAADLPADAVFELLDASSGRMQLSVEGKPLICQPTLSSNCSTPPPAECSFPSRESWATASHAQR